MKKNPLSADGRVARTARPVKNKPIAKQSVPKYPKQLAKQAQKVVAALIMQANQQETHAKPNSRDTAVKLQPEMKVTSSTPVAAPANDDSFETLLARHTDIQRSAQKKERDDKPTGELSMSWKLKPNKSQQREDKEDRANRRSASKNTLRKMKR